MIALLLYSCYSTTKGIHQRLGIWFLAWFLLLSLTMQLSLPGAFAADTDGDGLLDLIDVPGFDPNASRGSFWVRRIQDLDGASLLTNATELLMEGNRITSIESGDFAGLDNLQVLRLDTNGLTSIERGDFAGLDNLEALLLRGNQITSVERGDFVGLDNLQRLWLSGNRITSIERGDFVGLDKLQRLWLGNNRITTVESEVFQALENLQELYLWENQITSVESGAFQKLDNLQRLELWDNQITSIERGDFSGLEGLETLVLRGNQIASVENGDFAGLESLQNLSLSRNQITSVESGDFAGLGNLQELWLDLNQITSVESGAFAGLDNLQVVRLDGNGLTSIERGDYAGLEGLETLVLRGNQITSVERGAFSGLDGLRTLDLRGNNITQLNLSNATFDSLQSCYRLDGEPYHSSGFCVDSRITNDSTRITNVVLEDAVLSLGSFEAISGETQFITSASLVGLTFSDTYPADMSRLLEIPTLDNVTVDEALFERYAAEFEAFDALPGNTVTTVPEPSAIGLLAMGLLALVITKRSKRTPGSAVGLNSSVSIRRTHRLQLRGSLRDSGHISLRGNVSCASRIGEKTDASLRVGHLKEGCDTSARQHIQLSTAVCFTSADAVSPDYGTLADLDGIDRHGSFHWQSFNGSTSAFEVRL